MKNTFRVLMTVAVVFGINESSFAQKDKKAFQGTITYNISYKGENLTPAQKAQLPASVVETIKDCKTKTETAAGILTITSITDGTAKSATMLIDIGDNKFALKQTEADINKKQADEPKLTVNITQETKVISGFTCKKAIVTTTLEDGTVNNDTLYFTEELGCKDINFSSGYKDIPGKILQYTVYNTEMQFSTFYTVKEIKKSKISDNIFLIPIDYKETTEEELNKMFGGDE
ncbi:MAG: hypothetical protein WC868_05610 [Bacteroidales bacterium]